MSRELDDQREYDATKNFAWQHQFTGGKASADPGMSHRHAGSSRTRLLQSVNRRPVRSEARSRRLRGVLPQAVKEN